MMHAAGIKQGEWGAGQIEGAARGCGLSGSIRARGSSDQGVQAHLVALSELTMAKINTQPVSVRYRTLRIGGMTRLASDWLLGGDWLRRGLLLDAMRLGRRGNLHVAGRADFMLSLGLQESCRA